MPEIEFRVLGPIEIVQDGQVRHPTTAQQRTVLAMLLLDLGYVVSTGRLTSALWAEDPPPTAMNALRVNMAKLRKLLAPDATVRLSTVGQGWQLVCDRSRVDLYRFRDLVTRAGDPSAEASAGLLRRALSLWRGPALADAAGDWLTEVVADGLEEERLAAIEDRIASEVRSGSHQTAIPELSVLTVQNPLRERLAQLLMSALHSSGRTAEALEVFRRTRMQLVEELGVEPSALLQKEHQRLLSGSDESAATDMKFPIPRQLPAVAAQFTGRALPLVQLNELLPDGHSDDGPGNMAVGVITGTAGIGKTALAVHWAHQVADRFPDGQLYVNLRGFDPVGQPVAAADAARAFLDAMGVAAAKIPTDLDAKAALYRSLLADKRVLVILDNARDSEQVRPLLPGASGSLAVVTSRNQLSSLVGQGAHPVALDQFDADEAGRFLTQRLREGRTKAEPEATDRIIDACAGLPLALAIVAARAAAHPDFPLAALATELHRSNERLNALAGPDPAFDVRAVFSWSYRALNPDTARLFRLLSVHPGPDITPAAAASLARIPFPQAGRLLAELARANLIVEQTPGRFSFHDLIRMYATELAATDDTRSDRDTATHRALDHYLHTAYAINRLIDPIRDPLSLAPVRAGVTPERPAEDESAMAWFAAEHSVLLALVDHAAEQGFDAHCWQFAWALQVYFYRRGRWHDLAAVCRTALDSTRKLGDAAAESRGLRSLAWAYTHLDRFDDAHMLLEEALALSRALGDQVGQAHVYQVRGRLWRRQERFAEALDCNLRALDLFTATGHRGDQARALGSIGWHHALVGELAQALHYCERAMAIMKEIDDRSGRAHVSDSFGYIHHRLGQHDLAVTHYQRALNLYRDLGSRSGEADALTGLGDAQHALGDLTTARRTWQRALVIYDDLGRPDAEKVRARLDKSDTETDRLLNADES